MTELTNKYWTGEKTVPKLGVDWGKTDNLAVNAFLAAQNIYYEFLNNGGWNFDDYYDGITPYFKNYIEDLRKAKIGQFLGDINLADSYDDLYNELSHTTPDGYYTRLDAFMEDVIERVLMEDLTTTIITIYYDYDKKLISKQPQDAMSTCTFGFSDAADKWFDDRVNSLGFKIID